MLGLYVHIPFCVRKCGYCDFNSYAGLEALVAPYLRAVVLEAAVVGPKVFGRRVGTVYIGDDSFFGHSDHARRCLDGLGTHAATPMPAERSH